MAFWFMVTVAHAQDPEFEVEAQVRPRVELDSGRDATEGGSQAFVVQRSRLGATGTVGDVSARVLVQDVRQWGAEDNTLTDFSAEGLDVHLGYLRWAPSGSVSAIVGRQEFVLHEQRLLGSADWLAQARSFDGGRAVLETDVVHADVAGALTGIPGDVREHRAGVAWARVGVGDDEGLADAVYIYDVDLDADRRLHTFGVYAKGAAGPLSGRIEAYGQVSEPGVGAMVGARATVAPESALSPSATVWYDHLTATGDSTVAFNTLYATNHKFYGYADIAWFVAGGTVDGRGLQDLALKLSMKPRPIATVQLDGHVFLPGLGAEDPSAIGQEVDLTGAVAVAKGFKVSGGGALFFSEPGSDRWAFLEIDVGL